MDSWLGAKRGSRNRPSIPYTMIDSNPLSAITSTVGSELPDFLPKFMNDQFTTRKNHRAHVSLDNVCPYQLVEAPHRPSSLNSGVPGPR